MTDASTIREDLRPVIAITLGDPAGVGAEVTLKALADPDVQRSARFTVLGERAAVTSAERSTGILIDALPVEFRDCNTLPSDAEIDMGTLQAEYGAAAVRYVHDATLMCLRGEADAMVTAPLNKEAVTLRGMQFSGHTEYIAELCNATDSRMLLARQRLSVVHVSTHISLREAGNLDTARIIRTIELGITLASMTGWPITAIIALTAIVTIFYTLLGGVEAVVWSDVVQGFVLWTGILVSLGYLLLLPAQGPSAVLANAWTHHKMSLGSTTFRFDQPTIIVLVIYGFFFYLQKYTADQTVVQRYLIARSDRSALRGIALGAGLCLPVWAAFMLIGSLLWSFYRLTGETIPKSITKADGIFPHFLVTHIPSGFAGLFVAALLGSAMSMLASDMNCLSVIAVEDFYRFARPRSTDRQLLRAGRIVVAASGVAAALVALRLAHTQGSALSLYYTITAVVAGGLAGLFLLAFLIPRATREGAITGLVVSLIFTAWATFTEGGKILNLGHWNFTWHDYMIGAIGHVILLVVGIAASLLLPGSPLAPDLTWQGWRRQSRQQVPAGV